MAKRSFRTEVLAQEGVEAEDMGELGGGGKAESPASPPEKTRAPRVRTDEGRELSAIRRIREMLKELPFAARRRVLDYVESTLAQDAVAEKEAAFKADIERRQAELGFGRDTQSQLAAGSSQHVGGFLNHRV